MGFEIIVISTPDKEIKEESTKLELFESGLKTFHVRKPSWPLDMVETYIHSIPKIYHPRLVLHSHYSLAVKYQLKGIHLTEKSKKTPAVIAQLKNWNDLSISASFHNLEDLNRHRRKYDYVFLSPIFDSISKIDYKSSIDLPKLGRSLEHWQKRTDYIPKVVALGGIDAGNIKQLQQMGFAGAALLGSIWQSQQPVKEFLHVQAAIL
jgi:thiamine-phosphate pyrophosphorylase